MEGFLVLKSREFWDRSRKGKLPKNSKFAEVKLSYSGNHRYYEVFNPESYKEQVLKDGNVWIGLIRTNENGIAIKLPKR